MLATSPQTPGKPRHAFVDAALAFDKVPQRLIQVLEFSRVPQHTGPFAAGSSVATLSEKANGKNEDTNEVAFGRFTTRVFE
jgi:hypothetical protein